MQTAQIATDICGTGPYHQEALAALPLLLRQAEADEPIKYGSLAVELGMPNARNLNYPLGSIGTTLQQLGGRRTSARSPASAIAAKAQSALSSRDLAGRKCARIGHWLSGENTTFNHAVWASERPFFGQMPLAAADPLRTLKLSFDPANASSLSWIKACLPLCDGRAAHRPRRHSYGRPIGSRDSLDIATRNLYRSVKVGPRV